jgi:hypothetical protein
VRSTLSRCGVWNAAIERVTLGLSGSSRVNSLNESASFADRFRSTSSLVIVEKMIGRGEP